MKKYCVILLSLLFMGFSSAFAQETVTVGNLIYIINTSQLTATLSGYTTNDIDNIIVPGSIVVNRENYGVTAVSAGAFSGNNAKSITFPESIKSIGNSAMSNCKNLTEVILPDGLQIISYKLFDGCNSLVEIKIPESVTTIHQYAFKGCESLNEIRLPQNLKTLAQSAFYNCTGLKKVFFSESPLEVLQAYMFYGCSNLEELVLAPSIKQIHNTVCYGLENNIKLVLPSTLLTIQNKAFNKAPSELRINATTPPYIREGNPFGYEKARTIIVPPGCLDAYKAKTEAYDWVDYAVNLIEEPVKIENGQFSYGDFQYKIISDADNTLEIVKCIGTRNMPAGYTLLSEIKVDGKSYKITNIGAGAFDGCDWFQSFVVPSSYVEIGAGAFKNLVLLSKLEIAPGVKIIGSESFENDTLLKEVTLPESVEKIESRAFKNCKKLERVILPSTLKSIDASAFENCCALNDVYFNSENPPSIDTNAFSGIDMSGVRLWVPEGCKDKYKEDLYWSSFDILEEGDLVEDAKFDVGDFRYMVLSRKDKTVAVVDYFGDKKAARIDIPTVVDYSDEELTVTEISDNVFMKCSMTSVNLPQSLQKIGASAFEFCENLISVQFPSTLTYIGERAFKECCKLQKLEIPDGVEYIGKMAFYYCENVVEIKLPNSLKTIGPNAFEYCKYVSSIEIPDGVEAIERSTFALITNLRSLSLPASLKTIGANAFKECTSLGEIISDAVVPPSINGSFETVFKDVIPDKVTLTVPVGSLYSYKNSPWGWFNVKEVGFEDNYQIFEYGDFRFKRVAEEGLKVEVVSYLGDKTLITSLEIPTEAHYKGYTFTVSQIGEGAFSGCSSLEEIVIPDEIKAINDNAFENCVSLTEISLPKNLSHIGNGAFAQCSSIKSLEFPSSLAEIGDGAFAGCKSLEEIYLNATTPPAIESVDNVFNECPSDITLWIPAGTMNAYKNTTWIGFKDIREIGGGSYDPNNPGGGDDPNNPGGGDDPNNPGGGDDPNNPGGGDDPNNPGGGDNPSDDKPSGTINVNADGEQLRIYDMRGVYVGSEVSALRPGIYIFRQGSKSWKTVIK